MGLRADVGSSTHAMGLPGFESLPLVQAMDVGMRRPLGSTRRRAGGAKAMTFTDWFRDKRYQWPVAIRVLGNDDTRDMLRQAYLAGRKSGRDDERKLASRKPRAMAPDTRTAGDGDKP